jgi:hypothetical protein
LLAFSQHNEIPIPLEPNPQGEQKHTSTERIGWHFLV